MIYLEGFKEISKTIQQPSHTTATKYMNKDDSVHICISGNLT